MFVYNSSVYASIEQSDDGNAIAELDSHGNVVNTLCTDGGHGVSMYSVDPNSQTIYYIDRKQTQYLYSWSPSDPSIINQLHTWTSHTLQQSIYYSPYTQRLFFGDDYVASMSQTGDDYKVSTVT
jgi:hypothetical protein